MKRLNIQICFALCLFLAGCRASPPGPISEVPWPTEGWQTSAPEEQGMDSGLLQEMQESIKRQRLNLHSLLVIRNGKIVSENYYGGYAASTRHEQYSVTKSFIGTLVGIAIEKGWIRGLDTPVLKLYPGESFANPDPRKDAITVEDLLTMRSGLDWEEGDAAYMALYNSPNWAKHMLDLPMAAEPGTRFVYCSGCSHVLSDILWWWTWRSVRGFANKNLLKPMGIRDYGWDVNKEGVHLGGWGMQLTPRDMAKLGYLYLNEGVWDGKQLVPAEWVAESVKARVETGEGAWYGYQWWVFPEFPGTVNGAYSALGHAGQAIFVIPELDLVVVTTAEINGHDAIYHLIADYVIPAVQE
jgi:CubicO group peptidase (beta-lactamase class C family)